MFDDEYTKAGLRVAGKNIVWKHQILCVCMCVRVRRCMCLLVCVSRELSTSNMCYLSGVGMLNLLCKDPCRVLSKLKVVLFDHKIIKIQIFQK